jgi:hypothetical protein
MRAFKGRRLNIALMLAVFVPISVLGIQTLAFAARNPAIGSAKAHNPTCGSAFGERVCITASPTGLTFKWSGYSYRAGAKETLGIQGTWAGPGITQHVQWSGSGTHTVFVRLKTPDDYAGWVSLESPEGGVSKFINFSLVVPQVGASGLAVITKSLPAAKLGIPYLFRLSARGGTRPYSWYPIVNLPKGLTLLRTGSKAGTIAGTPLKVCNPLNQPLWVPVIVHDAAGHAAYAYFQLPVNS